MVKKKVKGIRDLTAWVASGRVELKEVAAALQGFGGYGTGEELYDYLTNTLNWEDERTDRFMQDLEELERSL